MGGGDGHQTVGFRSVVPIERLLPIHNRHTKNTELAPAGAPSTKRTRTSSAQPSSSPCIHWALVRCARTT